MINKTKEYALAFLIEAEPGGRPVYRIWVDNELMCERTFWMDAATNYISEQTVVELEEGRHFARLELVTHSTGTCCARKIKVTDLLNNSTAEHTIPPMQGREQIIAFSAK